MYNELLLEFVKKEYINDQMSIYATHIFIVIINSTITCNLSFLNYKLI